MTARVLIAVPAYNEEKALRASIEALHAFARASLADRDVRIVIADNGSDDGTGAIADDLARRLPGVSHLVVAERGKGVAVRRAWESADADVYAFMDADLATDLAALPELLRLAATNGGVAIGSRALPASKIERSPYRRALSLGYKVFLRAALGTRISDAPCGFKAAAAPVVRDVMPAVGNDRWFFDTELVVRAERAGYPVDEVAVTWREPAGRVSKVRAGRLVVEYAREVLRLRRDLARRP